MHRSRCWAHCAQSAAGPVSFCEVAFAFFPVTKIRSYSSRCFSFQQSVLEISTCVSRQGRVEAPGRSALGFLFHAPSPSEGVSHALQSREPGGEHAGGRAPRAEPVCRSRSPGHMLSLLSHTVGHTTSPGPWEGGLQRVRAPGGSLGTPQAAGRAGLSLCAE